MKWAAVAVVLVGLVVVGCGGSEVVSSDSPVGGLTEPDETAATTTVAPTTTTEDDSPFGLSWGESAVAADGAQIATADAPTQYTGTLSQYERESLGEGVTLWYCSVTIENTGTEPLTYNPYFWAIFDSENGEHDALVTMVDNPPMLGSGELIPGRKVTGALYVALPDGKTIAYVDYRPEMYETVASWGE